MLSVNSFTVPKPGVATRSRLLWFAAAALWLGSAGIGAAAECRHVHGHFDEQAVAPPACTSPVGVCTAGSYSGGIRGEFMTTVSYFNTATPNFPDTFVGLFNADSTIHARVGTRVGDLMIKNAGAFHVAGDGEILDLQTIVGGTGALTGATGTLVATGTFVSGVGQSEYVGTICLP